MIDLTKPITIEVSGTITITPDGQVTIEPTPVEPEPVEPSAEPDPVEPVTPAEGLALEYVGGCRIRDGVFGDSRSAYGFGTFAVTNDGIWISGHTFHNAVGMFGLPSEWSMTTDVAGMAIAENVTPYARIEPQVWDRDTPPRITGIFPQSNRVLVSVGEHYDARGDNAYDLAVLNADGTQEGWFQILGGARAAGWIQETPAEWVSAIGPYYMGHSSNLSINSRLSLGPSLYGWDGVVQSVIDPTPFMHYTLANPLGDLDTSTDPANPVFNQLSRAVYGFIHGDEYICVGYTGGLESGIGYKIEQVDKPGSNTPGYAPYHSEDWVNYVWRYRVQDILDAANPWDAQPHSYGELSVPGTVDGGFYKDGFLYTLDSDGDRVQSQYEAQPVIRRYRIL